MLNWGGQEGVAAKMRILVTGAKGMLGTDLVPALESAHQVVPADLEQADLTSWEAAWRLVEGAQPELVIHAAAMTDVDGCERDPEAAWRHNTLATWHVAAACQRLGAALLYLSTDFVFDGTKGGPYHEFDQPHPLNAYGASKWAGEVLVRQLCPCHYVVRTAWLFGRSGRNFVRTILARAREGGPLQVVADQVGSPTYSADLAAAIARHLVGNPCYGTYHLTNTGWASWADLAREAVAAAGLQCPVTEISAADWPSPTRRPAMSALEPLALRLQGRADMRPWQEAVAEMVRGLAAG